MKKNDKAKAKRIASIKAHHYKKMRIGPPEPLPPDCI